MPQCEGDSFRDLDGLIDTFKESHLGFFYPSSKRLGVRIDKIERYRKAKEVWPDTKHEKSIP